MKQQTGDGWVFFFYPELEIKPHIIVITHGKQQEVAQPYIYPLFLFH